MISVQTNVTSLIAQENLRVDTNFQSRTIQRLTSGYRINSSGDDPAGLAVANGYRNSEAELTQGIQNANDGISTLQIIDGGENNIGQILDRLKTLATQSASDTFNGSRQVLNSEFQGLVSEINRQAQSIGLDQNGAFARNLSVYIGGGRAHGTATAATNSSLQFNLSGATVDAKSLGLTGMQALGGTTGTTDIGNGSVHTSVSAILSDNTTPVADETDFYISGPGFSGASRVKVAVNTSSVSDTNSLVTAINDAIANAGNEATPSASAFKAANITASVNTDSSGKQQLAFSSSTTAFQVEAGDSVANALMGNFANASVDATAAAMGSTYTGGATAASTATLANPTNISFQIQGAGLATPVTLTLQSSSTTVGAAVTDLQTQVAANSYLAGAGVSVTQAGSGAALVFHSAKGEQLQVNVTGDAVNALGMGSFVAGAGGAVDYKQLTGATFSNLQNFGTATLQFSFNGQASNTNQVVVDMTAGPNASAATVTSSDSSTTPVAINPNNNVLNLMVDGTAYSVTLSPNGTATKNSIAAQINSQTGGSLTASVAGNVLTLKDNTKGAGGTIQVLDGSANVTLGLTSQLQRGQSASAADVANQINQQVAANTTLAAAGIKADGSSGSLVVNSTNNTNFRLDATGGTAYAASITGATGSDTAATAAVKLAANTGTYAITTGTNDDLNLKVDGTTYNVVLTAGATDRTSLLSQINVVLSTHATAAFSGNDLTITSATTGASSSVQVLAGGANATLGLTQGATATGAVATSGAQQLAAAGSGPYTINDTTNDSVNVIVNGSAKSITLTAGAGVTQATIAGEIAAGLGAGFTAAYSGNQLHITSTGTGANQTVQVLAGSANATIGLATGFVTGTNATGGIVTGSNAASFAITGGSNDTLKITIAGANNGAAQTVTLTGGAPETKAAVIDDINNQLIGGHASLDGLNDIIITADQAGVSVSIDGTVAHDASQTLGLTTGNVVTSPGVAAQGADFAGSTVAATLDIDQGLTNQLKIKIDAQATAQTITLTGGSRTAQQVIGEINSQLSGGTAYLDGSNNIQIKVDATGAGHSVEITAGNANTAFGFTPAGSATSGVDAGSALETGSTIGTTFDISSTVNNTLLVTVDGGSQQTITLGAGAAVSEANIVSQINSQLQNATAFIDASTGKVAIASNNTGLAGSSVAVAGTAATALGFSGSTATGTDAVAGYTIGSSNDTLTVSVDGSSGQAITLAQGSNLTAASVAADIQAKLVTAGFTNVTATADATTNVIKISSSTTGTTSSIAVSVSQNDAAGTLGLHEATTYLGTAQDVGFGIGGASFTGNASTAANNSVLNSGGATSTGALSFTPLKFGSDSQAISISGTDSSGQMQSATITLANNATSRTGRSLDETIAAINTALQQTNVPTLQSVVAVKDHTSAEQIDFVSSLAAFQVSVGSTGSGSGIGSQGSTVKATALDGGSSLDISTQLGGTAAISALTRAVSALGAAQANVGKAQNTLNYAIGLAESQTANLSAAESRIRDADMASEAANLTKAQVLQQSAIAAMVQANSAPQAVLTLLRG